MSDSGSDRERPKRTVDRSPPPRERTPPRRSRESMLCFKWPEGTCNYGDDCRFIHEGPGGTSGGGGGGGGRGGSRGRSSDRGGGSSELFMRGLDYYMSKEDVREEVLGDMRGVQDIVLPLNRDRDDQNRGFAILKFNSTGAARAAMDKLNGMTVRGRGLYVRWSEDGGDRYDRRPRYGGGGGYGGGGYGDRGGSSGRSNECYRWAREGRCDYGKDCRFSHAGGGGGGGRSGSSGRGGGGRRDDWRGGRGGGRSDVCYAYQRDGNCSYGDSCRFVHE